MAKNSKQELMEKTDKAINELVTPKEDLLKAYNYYNGVRDKDQFRYLEELYGINTPTSLHFTPLIKKHVDALVGEYLSVPIVPKVSCKDTDTISLINRDKQLSIDNLILTYLKGHLKSFMLNSMTGKETKDLQVETEMRKIMEDIDTNFVSDYEIAALNVITYIMLSRTTDMLTALRDLSLDLFITGYAFYKVKPTLENNNVEIKVLNPLNTFVDRNFESPYIKNSYRSVVRTWMTKAQILNEYGKDMSADDRKELENKWDQTYDDNMYYMRLHSVGKLPATEGLIAGVEVTPGYPDVNKEYWREFIPVYEVEWLETDKDFVMQRYNSVRIGDDIYILYGKDKNVIRSLSNPSQCTLTVGGIYFLNRGVRPYSLVLACAHLQDQYDLLHFYRDNLIANSGTVGDWIDLTLIPESLGVNLPERLVKWQLLKKQGLAILDSSLEGRMASGLAPLNTIFNGYDDTVKQLAIAAILLAIDSIEQTASSITGVFKERLNMIETYDRVSNVKIGQANSFIITKQYYHLMDLVVNELLIDCLNMAKRVFKNGLSGVIILGDKLQRVFTALPEHFTMTDYDIRIITSSDATQDLELVKALVPELVKALALPPDIIIDAVTTKNLPDLKLRIAKAMKKQKDENDVIKLLTDLLEDALQLLKLAGELIQLITKLAESLNKEKMQLEQEKMKTQSLIDWYRALTERLYREDMVAEAKRRTELEIEQIHDGNPYNDRIRLAGLGTNL